MFQKTSSRGSGRGGTQILTLVNDTSVGKERNRKKEKERAGEERKKKTPIRSILGLLEITLLISN